MCGICGIINLNTNKVDESLIRSMMSKIKHRGPNDDGIYINENIGFGFVRLSIIDLSQQGHQPMSSNEGRYYIVYNGEVFNYIELRDELIKKGYVFKSNTDTEVILYSYIEWGTGCLDKFNGMWAFVIYDSLNKKVFGARDRYGIKPLYIYQDKNRVIFASEIKAILSIVSEGNINRKILFDYLIYNRTDHTNETFFLGITKLPHGQLFEIDYNIVKIKQWYNLSERVHKKIITANEYYDLFSESIKIRLRSDVPLGVCLSGGLDSSSIVSVLLKKYGLKELNTFSAIYQSDENDESYFINQYKDQLNNMHYICPSADSFWNDYQKFIWVHNEPVSDTGPYIQYKVMELASKYVTVTLDGQGADEQLGGYHEFFGCYYLELLKTFRILTIICENVDYYKNHKSLTALKYFLYYLLPASIKRNASKKIYGNINKDFYHQYSNSSTIQEDLYNPINLKGSMLAYFNYKLEHLLKWEDLNSMAFSIESRVPFLDHNLVESTLSLPSYDIIKNGTTKVILRKAFQGILPEVIRTRQDKKGFSNPRAKWFRDPRFKELVFDILDSQLFQNLGYFDVKKCKMKYQHHLQNKSDESKDIWKWINLYHWHEMFGKN